MGANTPMPMLDTLSVGTRATRAPGEINNNILPGQISTRFPTPCTRSPEHSGQTTKTRPGTLNSGSKPWTRIETGSHVLFMTLDSITIGAAQDRHYSPAEPPHTKAYSTINPVPLLPQPNGSKQQGTWVLLF